MYLQEYVKKFSKFRNTYPLIMVMTFALESYFGGSLVHPLNLILHQYFMLYGSRSCILHVHVHAKHWTVSKACEDDSLCKDKEKEYYIWAK